MCGLVGVIDRRSPAQVMHILDQMRQGVAHRGPDDEGLDFIESAGVGFAFARLSIIDLSDAAHQPMWNEEHTVGLVFNGEIYNFMQIRSRLVKTGWTFKSRSDTEVVLRAFEQWGPDLLQRLDGMFSLAIIDRRRSPDDPDIWLARDRMGEKPLYYWWEPGSKTFAFASELKALLHHPGIIRQVSREGLSAYLELGYVPAPLCIVQGVSKLPAANVMHVTGSGPQSCRRYWTPTVSPVLEDSDDAHVSRIRSLVTSSVSSRMVSDVPLGAFLSGGVDSSLVVGLMSEVSSEPIRTFSTAYDVGHRSFKYNVDADAAEIVSRRFGTKHTRLTLDPRQDLPRIFPQVVFAGDEPHANPTLVSTYLLAEKVRLEGIEVVLTGDGSDEVFGGYARYQRDRWVDWLSRVPKPARKAIGGALGRSGKGEAFGKALQKADLPTGSPERYLTWWSVLDEERQNELLRPPWRLSPPPAAEVVRDLTAATGPFTSSPQAVSFTDLMLWIPEESNMRVDKMTMAHALESRAPFQNHELVEYVLRIPFDQKVGAPRFTYKRLLRRAFADLLPDEILSRPKWGWMSPVHYWVNDFMWPQICELVSSLPDTGIFDDSVRHLVDEHPSHIPATLWMLASFALWHRMYIDEISPNALSL